VAHDNENTSQATQKLIDLEVKRLLKVSPYSIATADQFAVMIKSWRKPNLFQPYYHGLDLSSAPKNAQSSNNSARYITSTLL